MITILCIIAVVAAISFFLKLLFRLTGVLLKLFAVLIGIVAAAVFLCIFL